MKTRHITTLSVISIMVIGLLAANIAAAEDQLVKFDPSLLVQYDQVYIFKANMDITRGQIMVHDPATAGAFSIGNLVTPREMLQRFSKANPGVMILGVDLVDGHRCNSPCLFGIYYVYPNAERR